MKIRRSKPQLSSSVSLVALAAAASAALGAAPAMALMPSCNVATLNSLEVPNVVIVAAIDTPAKNGTPEFCDVFGTLKTTGFGAPDGLAKFEMNLPINWNHKFLLKGIGGFAGASIIAFGSDNPVDASEELPKGYATALSDTGHTGVGHDPGDFTGIVTDARWALNPDGTPDEAKLTDYYFRATHEMAVAGKQIVEGFYDGKLQRSYFDGCSNGGRMAFQEASRFPEDFDGIIAGDPFMSIRSIAAGAHFTRQELTVSNFIPFTLLPAIDQATIAACDALDGVKDGLIQNPAACSFKAETLLCQKGQTTNCLSPGQVDTLKAYFAGARDDDGNVVYPGFTISDLSGLDGAAAWTNGFFLQGQKLPGADQTAPPNDQATFDVNAPEPWGDQGFAPAPLGWQFVDHATKYIVERDPNFNTRNFSGPGPLSDAVLSLFDKRTEAGDADDPANFTRFVAQNRKLLIYHGLSDPALTAIRTMQFYEDLAQRSGGIEELQENVRLFLAPGMHHCSGGPGPNLFDTLTALENWVEKGIGPDSIVATKFNGDNPANGVARTMPLCKFPEEAQFKGGNVNDAANWVCSPSDRRMLQVGQNGRDAGLGLRQAAEFNDDHRRDRDHDGDGDRDRD